MKIKELKEELKRLSCLHDTLQKQQEHLVALIEQEIDASKRELLRKQKEEVDVASTKLGREWMEKSDEFRERTERKRLLHRKLREIKKEQQILRDEYNEL